MYEETQDGKGFYLPTGEFFKFDQYRGWYDEQGHYYNANGEPSQPPAPAQGKNKGFSTQVYEPQSRGQGYGGYGQGRQRDQGGYDDRKQGYGGGYRDNGRRNQGGYGGRNNRRYDEDFDDDPINQEFGCDDDYYPEKTNIVSKDEEERFERAYKAEKKKEELLTYIEGYILKDSFNLYIDVMPTGKQAIQQKDVEALLSSRGLGDLKVEEKKSLSTTTTLVFKVTLKSKDQALKLLNIEGCATEIAKLTKVEIPTANQVADDEDDHADESPDKAGQNDDHSEGEEESGEEEDYSDDEGHKNDAPPTQPSNKDASQGTPKQDKTSPAQGKPKTGAN